MLHILSAVEHSGVTPPHKLFPDCSKRTPLFIHVLSFCFCSDFILLRSTKKTFCMLLLGPPLGGRPEFHNMCCDKNKLRNTKNANIIYLYVILSLILLTQSYGLLLQYVSMQTCRFTQLLLGMKSQCWSNTSVLHHPILN